MDKILNQLLEEIQFIKLNMASKAEFEDFKLITKSELDDIKLNMATKSEFRIPFHISLLVYHRRHSLIIYQHLLLIF